jgi:hypothetical protein
LEKGGNGRAAEAEETSESRGSPAAIGGFTAQTTTPGHEAKMKRAAKAGK